MFSEIAIVLKSQVKRRVDEKHRERKKERENRRIHE